MFLFKVTKVVRDQAGTWRLCCLSFHDCLVKQCLLVCSPDLKSLSYETKTMVISYKSPHPPAHTARIPIWITFVWSRFCLLLLHIFHVSRSKLLCISWITNPSGITQYQQLQYFLGKKCYLEVRKYCNQPTDGFVFPTHNAVNLWIQWSTLIFYMLHDSYS